MVAGIEYDTETEFLIVQLKQKVKLRKGFNYVLLMTFVGRLNDELRGFYRSSYIEDGVERCVCNMLDCWC